ncbi:MAG: hypothetical protein ACK4MF_10050 [Hyphomicrobiaceae bacterium]
MSMSTRTIAASALGLAAVAMAAGGASSTFAVGTAADGAAAHPIARMMGRWAGDAAVVPVSGPVRNYKCVVTYRGAGDGTSIAQTLRCRSDDYKLEAATLLSINGNELTGQWEDRINALGGEVRGSMTENGFAVRLAGRFFEADMLVAGSGCEQNVTLTPVRADYIRELSASLRKC